MLFSLPLPRQLTDAKTAFPDYSYTAKIMTCELQRPQLSPILMEISNTQHHASLGMTRYCKGNAEDIKITTHPGGIVAEEDDHDRSDGVRHEASSALSLSFQIETLYEIASMENVEYQQRLVENALPTLQDPSLSKLNLSIHRFQALVSNLTHENDSQTAEILQLQSELAKSQQHVEKLERAIFKLHTHNVKLKKKSKADKSITRKLIEQVKRFDAARRLRQEEEEVGKLLQHEQVLRERSDSNFSDIDGLQDFDNGSLESMDSTRSLVTSEPPTIRIHRQRTLTWPLTDFEKELDYDDDPSLASDKANVIKFSDENKEDECSSSITLEESVAEDELSDSSKPKGTLMGFWSFNQHGDSTAAEKAESGDVESGGTSKVGTDAVPASTLKSKDDRNPLNSVMSMFSKASELSKSAKEETKTGKDDKDMHALSTPKPKFEMWKRNDTVTGIPDGKDLSTSTAGKGRKGLLDLSDDTDDLERLPSSDDTCTVNNASCGEGPISNNERRELNQPAATKFKTSMKNMGKLFTFH
jgi:hypothetical protein